jgi:hypothetical protein
MRPARKLDEILLERAHAERVLDLEVGELAVRAVRGDEVTAVAAAERRRRAGVGERRVGEIAEDRALVGDLHREIVVGAAPCRGLRGMAFGAGLSADVLRVGQRRVRSGGCIGSCIVARVEPQERADRRHEHCGRDGEANGHAPRSVGSARRRRPAAPRPKRRASGRDVACGSRVR